MFIGSASRTRTFPQHTANVRGFAHIPSDYCSGRPLLKNYKGVMAYNSRENERRFP